MRIFSKYTNEEVVEAFCKLRDCSIFTVFFRYLWLNWWVSRRSEVGVLGCRHLVDSMFRENIKSDRETLEACRSRIERAEKELKVKIEWREYRQSQGEVTSEKVLANERKLKAVIEKGKKYIEAAEKAMATAEEEEKREEKEKQPGEMPSTLT